MAPTPTRTGELSFTGPATFFKAPYRSLQGGDWNADIALLGFPVDFAVGFRPGSRFAPNALREASGRYAVGANGYYDFENDRFRLAGASLADAGDVDPAQLEYQETNERFFRAAKQLRERCRFPVFVGGDHSISYPTLRAFADVEDLHVVQMDAHLDYTDARNGTRYANSCPFRRAVEEVSNLTHVTVVGLRGLRADREAVNAARGRGHTLFSTNEARHDPEKVLAALPKNKPVYISYDIDVLDPTLAPGTSSPEVDGMTYGETLAVLERVFQQNRVVGFDLTELAPTLDPSGLTSLVGARLLAEVACLWWEHEPSR